MDFSLSDVIWAFGIVVAVVVVGTAAAIYSACGGSISIGRAGSAAGLFFRALTWRILPSLTSWYERNRDYAVNRFEDYEEPQSGIAPALDGIEPPILPSVLPHQEAANTGTWIPIDEALPRSALLDILARQRVDNKYVFSGNKLAELFVGSIHAVSRNTILDEVAKIRKGDQPEQVKRPSNRSERPPGGWEATT